MDRLLENSVQHKVVKAFERCSAMVLNVHGHAMQKSGYPDLRVAHAEWRGWIELKRDATPLKTLQALTIRKLKERGDHAIVLRYHNSTEHLYAENENGDSLGVAVELKDLQDNPHAIVELCIEACRLTQK